MGPDLVEIVEILKKTNSSYKNSGIIRPNGIFYADDYIDLMRSPDNWTILQGLTNHHYWDVSSRSSFFKIKDGVKPSDAIKSFFVGPTFADCANVIQASIYYYIMTKITEDKFNKIFGNPITQFVITKWLYEPFESTSREDPIGNPLFSIFDKIPVSKLNLDNLQHGDIVYIKGVEDYPRKHLAGFAPGWNLICVKKPSKSSKPKFIGFGPDTFSNGALTFEELKKVLIEYYNKNQSKETESIIEAKKSLSRQGSSSVGFLDYEDAVAILAESLKDDKKDLGEGTIVGLTNGIRLIPTKLKLFISTLEKKDVWYDKHEDILLGEITDLSEHKQTWTNQVKIMSKISPENIDSTFDNYDVDADADKEKMLSNMKKFAYKVCSQNESFGPMGIITTGKAGIGKTHLSIAIMKFVSEKTNKKILYIDEQFIRENFQKRGGEYANYNDWVAGKDLIVLDDLNSIYGVGATFFKEAIKYVMTENKAIIVSSNNSLDMLYEALPFYVGFDSLFAKNFLVIKSDIALSYRKPWHTPDINSKTFEEKLTALASYEGGMAAGIVVHQKEIQQKDILPELTEDNRRIEPKVDEILIKMKYKYLDKQSSAKIRIAEEPIKNHIVHDLYMHNIDTFDTFIIKVNKVNDRNAGTQLIKLIEKVYDRGGKIIVIAENDNKFVENVNLELNAYLKETEKPRRLDRLRIIFPGLFDEIV